MSVSHFSVYNFIPSGKSFQSSLSCFLNFALTHSRLPRGLLTEKAAPVMNIIHSIFSLILKFRAQLIAQPWDSQQGEAVHPSFIAMQQSYNTFKYYSHFLFKGKGRILFQIWFNENLVYLHSPTLKFWEKDNLRYLSKLVFKVHSSLCFHCSYYLQINYRMYFCGYFSYITYIGSISVRDLLMAVWTGGLITAGNKYVSTYMWELF